MAILALGSRIEHSGYSIATAPKLVVNSLFKERSTLPLGAVRDEPTGPCLLGLESFAKQTTRPQSNLGQTQSGFVDLLLANKQNQDLASALLGDIPSDLKSSTGIPTLPHPKKLQGESPAQNDGTEYVNKNETE